MSGDDVRIGLPCLPPFARVARSAAAACGSLEGFSIDDLSDLRLLVDEVFTAMYWLGVRRVEMEMTPADGALIVRMRADGPSGPIRREVDIRLTEMLADVVAEDVRFELAGEQPRFAATLARS